MEIFAHSMLDWRDVLDITLVTLLLYHILRLLKGTRAMAAMVGLGILMVLYFISRNVGIYTLTWILQHIFSSLFLVIVIIFQQDIRQALGNMGARYFWKRNRLRSDALDELTSACVEMARYRVGALIILECTVPLGDTMRREGVAIDARISHKLLTNIFYPKAPLHDGAVIISKGRIMAAACILPLAVVPGQNFGTRHRAAIGITQESDAVAVVVSEERGEISVARKGTLMRNLDAVKLKQVLHEIL